MIERLKNNIYHYFLAWLGAVVYRFPSRRIFVLGVTGTKGKSTVLELIAFILEQAGCRVAVSSSVRHGASAMTMPGRFFLQRFLRRAADSGCQYALIEVTSQGVLQQRHCFIDWDAAVFTNLAPEHLEAHGNLAAYRETKVNFFKYVALSGHRKTNGLAMTRTLFFINQDDDSKHYFIDAAGKKEIIFYGKSDLSSQLLGEFNQYNIGAAAAFARSRGIDEAVIARAVAEFPGIPGRMEFVQKEPFAVIIDYAHTPDSLRKVYRTLRYRLKVAVASRVSSEGVVERQTTTTDDTFDANETNRLICVLGSAGGGRDQWKRPELGKIAAEYCDEIILTNEDPYDEPPEKIIEEIFSGGSQIRNPRLLRPRADSDGQAKSEIRKILDRREAIKKALALARPGDTVVITGKGSEQWIHGAHGKKIPWSDKQVIRELLR